MQISLTFLLFFFIFLVIESIYNSVLNFRCLEALARSRHNINVHNEYTIDTFHTLIQGTTVHTAKVTSIRNSLHPHPSAEL